MQDHLNIKTKVIVHLSQLNEAKHNERDDKWFLEFSSEMIECGSVVIVNMCEVHKFKDTSIIRCK